MKNHKLPLILVSISFIFWFGLYFGLYFAGWPGEIHSCVTPPYCFCETVFQGDLAAQFSNTWSDLGFVVAAFFMAWHGSKLLKSKTEITTETNPDYRTSPLLISIYVSAILYMGPGSMFFHGSMTIWGGYLDVISMYVFVLFAIVYFIYRSWDLSIKTFSILYVLLCGSAIFLSVFGHGLTPKVFPFVAAILIVLALVQAIPIEKFSLQRKRDLNLNHKWLMLALFFFLSAATIWKLSDTGMPLCYPDSLLQGHAAWHILSACMTICIHFYFLSEKKLKRLGLS